MSDTVKKNNEKLYRNIVNGEIKMMNHNEFDKLQIHYDEFVTEAEKLIYKEIKPSEIFLDGSNSALSNKKKNNKKFIRFKKDDKDIIVYFLQIKNSGNDNDDNKRLQLYKKFLVKDTMIFALGVLSIGEEYIVSLTANLYDFLTRYDGESYSSYWISTFQEVEEIAFGKNEATIDEKYNYKTKDLKKIIKELDSRINYNGKNQLTSFNDLDVLFDFVETDLSDLKVEDFNDKNITDLIHKNKLIRNQKIVEEHLKNYQECINCLKKQTFIKNGLDIMYFDVHHFIPYHLKVQKKFKKTLDSKINLVSLCPLCHKMIHLSNEEEQGKMVEFIAKKVVNEDFLKVYPEYSLEKLKEIYLQVYRKELEENE
ncbi:HNH endonuclease [Spiroplasma chinense]|uniref:HNH endonuclease n=1 Tax=Spiroplasma chinense TaxID=216932 RepID=A0A5B9Y6W7_9MOLU|nr:HNH endonuclease [Spiroplasma chinense]QEH62017.1 HNH endonuclease [Spiroplasma chinense]